MNMKSVFVFALLVGACVVGFKSDAQVADKNDDNKDIGKRTETFFVRYCLRTKKFPLWNATFQ